MDSRRTVRAPGLTFLLLFAAAAANAAPLGDAAASNAAPAADVASGTWQKHQYSFFSMSFTSTYSCDGLADKLKLLLLASGARADAKASGTCSRGFGRPDKLAQADLTFYTLVPDANSKLGAGEQAEGKWRPVTLAVNSPRELGRGDCELVDQFRSQVLPMFATRDLSSQITCVPHQDSGSNVYLKFESFAAPPAHSTARAAN